MNESLERRVRERAKDRCEYCKIPAYISEFTFPLDHIIAQQHRGKTAYENLALSCPHDNFHKGPNIAGLDPETGRLTRLFNLVVEQRFEDRFPRLRDDITALMLENVHLLREGQERPRHIVQMGGQRVDFRARAP